MISNKIDFVFHSHESESIENATFCYKMWYSKSYAVILNEIKILEFCHCCLHNYSIFCSFQT